MASSSSTSPILHHFRRRRRRGHGICSSTSTGSLFSNDNDDCCVNATTAADTDTNTTTPASSNTTNPSTAAANTTTTTTSPTSSINHRHRHHHHHRIERPTTTTAVANDTTTKHDDDDDDDDSSSSSSSSSDDSSILSDTEYTADSIRRRHTRTALTSTTTTTTMVGAAADANVGGNKHDDVKHHSTPQNQSPPPRSPKQQQQQQQQHHNNNRRRHRYATTTTTAIEYNKLRNQFHYRDQIYHHLLSCAKTSRRRRIYLQSILDREYQVRYCTIDCILYKLQQQKQQQQQGNGNHDNIDNNSNNNTAAAKEMELLRQQWYQMVDVMKSTGSTTTTTQEVGPTAPPVRRSDGYNWWQFRIVNTITTMMIRKYGRRGDNAHSSSSRTDDVLFLRHLFVPAILSLFIHCMLHTSLYDGIVAILAICKSNLFNHQQTEPFWKDVVWTCIVFAFGILLLRCTGDIYWWSSNSDYQLIKFDFQNRRQLLLSRQRGEKAAVSIRNNDDPRLLEPDSSCTYTMTQITIWLRQRYAIRAVFFMVGYTCCYIASYEYLRYMTQFVVHCYNMYYVRVDIYQSNWYHHILSKLPSIVEMETKGICLLSQQQHNNMMDESFCSSTCQNELENRADQFLLWKLADMEYTRSTLSSESYEQYWNYWIHAVDMTKCMDYQYPGSVVVHYFADELRWNHDLPPLFLKHEQVLYCCFVILASVGILFMYGVKLWNKY